MVSENTLLLPTIVSTLSDVLTVVPNSPIVSTVPVTPAAPGTGRANGMIMHRGSQSGAGWQSKA